MVNGPSQGYHLRTRVYFLGLPLLHKIKSSLLWGVGEDATHIAEHIAAAHQHLGL